MLTLTAAQARRVRAALRPRGQPPPAVAFAPAGAGTLARLDAGEVVVQLMLPDVPAADPVAVPWPVVAAADGFAATCRGAGVEVRRGEAGRETTDRHPAHPVRPAPELPAEWAVVRAGRTAAHVVLAAGGLTAWLVADPAGRYPDPGSVVPADGAVRAWCRLGAADRKVVPAALDRLPGGDADPVVLDLGRRAVLRAAGGGGAAEVLADADMRW